MKHPLRLVSLFTILSLHCAHAQLDVTVGQITLTRETNSAPTSGMTQFMNGGSGLQVMLKLHGDALRTSKKVNFTITTAVDDTGANLAKPQMKHSLFLPEGDAIDFYSTLDLNQPAAGAKAIKTLTGDAELYMPQNDPASIVTVENLQQTAGTPIASPQLAAAGVEVTVIPQPPAPAASPSPATSGTMISGSASIPLPGGAISGSYSISGSASDTTTATGSGTPAPDAKKKHRWKKFNPFRAGFTVRVKFADPQDKIAGMEFQDATGKKIKELGWSGFSMFRSNTKNYQFASPLPADARLIIYLETPKAYTNVPFSFTNIALP